MIVVRDTETLKGKRLVATIGFFDGVHLGHRFLIHELKQVAEAAGLPSAVITFPEHPRAACRLSAEVAQFVRREIETFGFHRDRLLYRAGLHPRTIPPDGKRVYHYRIGRPVACGHVADRLRPPFRA